MEVFIFKASATDFIPSFSNLLCPFFNIIAFLYPDLDKLIEDFLLLIHITNFRIQVLVYYSLS